MEPPIDTSKFYKYITTLSFIGILYFFSFPTLLLKPHIDEMTKYNIEKAKLAAEYGYRKGVSMDLYTLYKDSINNGSISYFFYTKRDSLDDLKNQEVKYYSTLKLNASLKKKIDSLNLSEKQLGLISFKLSTISKTQKSLENNIYVHQVFSVTLGIVSLITFASGLFYWHKHRKSIDI